MLPPHGIQLAAHLISCYYGDLCSKVCECLLRRGTQTLSQIILSTELTRENVMNCLRVLIHQNFVQAFAIQQEGGFGEAPKVSTQYIALFDNVMHKLRVAKFMQIVSAELGEDCLGIFQGLIEHGRLSLDQIIDRNKEMAPQKRGSFDDQVVHENFSKLLNARFVERCPAPEPFLETPSEEETPAQKRRAKSAKIAEVSIEQRALAAAAPMESMRFLIEMDEEKGEESVENVSGKKRKLDDLKLDEDVGPNRKKEVLWRVNFEEFVCRLRYKACISYVKTRISDEASIVLEAILDLSRRSENKPKAEMTAFLSLNSIYDEVIKKEGGLGMDFERVRVSLDQLKCKTCSTDLDESYSFDIKGTLEMARKEEMESMVLRRYGREAYRIFRLLSKEGRFMENDKIADSTFVEKKDAIKILHKLWRDEYVHMEKVQAGGAGGRPSWLMLCRVNQERIRQRFVDELYHAALNLRLRLTHEKEQAREVLQLPVEKLHGELKRAYQRCGRVGVVLESSLMNLDVVIMQFHDF